MWGPFHPRLSCLKNTLVTLPTSSSFDVGVGLQRVRIGCATIPASSDRATFSTEGLACMSYPSDENRNDPNRPSATECMPPAKESTTKMVRNVKIALIWILHLLLRRDITKAQKRSREWDVSGAILIESNARKSEFERRASFFPFTWSIETTRTVHSFDQDGPCVPIIRVFCRDRFYVQDWSVSTCKNHAYHRSEGHSFDSKNSFRSSLI